MSKLFYVFYLVSQGYYDFWVKEEAPGLYDEVTQGDIGCVLEYEAQIKEQYYHELMTELLDCNDCRAYVSIIKKYENMED